MLRFIAPLSLALLLHSPIALAGSPPKLAPNVVTTDDCFLAFAGDAKGCDLGYCLGSVTGESDSIRSEKFSACSASGGRTVATQAVGVPKSEAAVDEGAQRTPPAAE